jgi:putative dehydrogenase
MSDKVGMLGLGIMGSAMSKNLLAAGFEVLGYDILEEKVRALEEIGGRGAGSVREVAQACPTVISVLPAVAALEKVGRELAAGTHPELVLLEASTMPLKTKLAVRDALAQAGAETLDCPLSGTGAQAVHKDLSVYASGDPKAYERCIPVFEGFARSHYYIGEYGMGSKMKFVANLLVAIHNVSAAEAFVLGMKAGLAPEMILKVISDGAGTSRMFEVRGPLMVAGRYEPATMKVDVFQKDMKIITSFATQLNCPLPLLSAAAQVYTAALANGRAQQDTASVCEVLEEMAGYKRE